MTRLFQVLAQGGRPEDALLYKGGKGAPVIQATPQSTPPPPTQEAAVQVEDTGLKKKVTQGKSELKIPLATAPDTGLKV